MGEFLNERPAAVMWLFGLLIAMFETGVAYGVLINSGGSAYLEALDWAVYAALVLGAAMLIRQKPVLIDEGFGVVRRRLSGAVGRFKRDRGQAASDPMLLSLLTVLVLVIIVFLEGVRHV